MNIKDAELLANNLLKEHGLHEWVFRFNNAKRYFGVCKFRTKVIEISKPLTKVNDIARIRNTLLHEIAHAKLPPWVGHGRDWKLVAESIGCDAEPVIISSEVNLAKPKWTSNCACGKVYRRYRLTRSARNGRCSSCLEKLKWRQS
jgi:predicted SprT family Zn-dependent metalloprotease